MYSNGRFHSLSEDQSVSLSGGGDGEMDVLFDLFKTDRTPDSDHVEETINMGKFLAVSASSYLTINVPLFKKLRDIDSRGPLKMSREMAHKVIVPPK
jgi:hypothetical protein